MSKEPYLIGIIGLGYVGLPLAVEFSKFFKVLGFDINTNRINQINLGQDMTLEISEKSLLDVLMTDEDIGLSVTSNSEQLHSCNIFIITVPTPTDNYNIPQLGPILNASVTVGKALSPNDIVIYESTVFPGLTEEKCVPILEQESNLIYNKEFFVGYSPERINPGDKKHTVTKIRKITSGSTPEIADQIDALYNKIITAGTFKASSIKVAEAAKVIENSQRDINIAFVNELAKIFNLLGIDTHEVLEAANTKWNFLPFKPGLVGGHCIGVDPYYLAYKAQEIGYHPEIILAGRRVNDSMGKFVAGEIIKLMAQKGIRIKGAKVLLLGITFKENCPDIRNTGAIEVYRECTSYNLVCDIYDPWAIPEDVHKHYAIRILDAKPTGKYDVVVLSVAHDEFSTLNISDLCKNISVVYDVKAVLDPEIVDGRL